MTFDDLLRRRTAAEIRAWIYAAIEAAGVATTEWKPGSPIRTLIAAVALVLSAFSGLQVQIARMAFLELSEGDWLTLVARYVYGVERDPGAFATGSVTLSNAGGGLYSGGPGDLVVRAGAKTYRNTAAFTLNPLQVGLVVPVQAVELGTAGSAAAATITALETALPGVTCTNAAALIGRDVETDLALRSRCLEKVGTLSPNGPRDAYSFVARSAVRADGTAIGVTRVRTVADGSGGVTVYVATATGGVTGTQGNPATDLGAIAAAIWESVEPLAVTATISSAVATSVPVTYELWVSDTIGLTADQIETAIEAALLSFIATHPIGGYWLAGEVVGRVYQSAIETAIGAAVAGRQVRIEVTIPAADVDLAENAAPVLGAINGTVHLVAGAIV